LKRGKLRKKYWKGSLGLLGEDDKGYLRRKRKVAEKGRYTSPKKKTSGSRTKESFLEAKTKTESDRTKEPKGHPLGGPNGGRLFK